MSLSTPDDGKPEDESPTKLPPKSRHKSIRIDPDLEKLITQRMLKERCDESTAIRSLIQDGAAAPRPHPIVAQIAPQEEREIFADLLDPWRSEFGQLKARLGALKGDPDDKELNDQIDRWRATADDLEPRVRELWKLADALARSVTGLDHEAYINFKAAKKHLCDVVEHLRSEVKRLGGDPREVRMNLIHLKHLEKTLETLAKFGL